MKIFAKLSQKSKLKLQLLTEMVIFLFNPPIHPDNNEGDEIEQNLENTSIIQQITLQ